MEKIVHAKKGTLTGTCAPSRACQRMLETQTALACASHVRARGMACGMCIENDMK